MTPAPGNGMRDDPDRADALQRSQARRGTWITLGVLVALIGVIVLLTPVTDTETTTRLTTLKYGPGNARLAADLFRQLGWPVQTRGVPLTGALDTSVIYAVFDGPTPMSPTERGALLTAVRGGAGLLVAPSSDGQSTLMASLGLRPGPAGSVHATSLGVCDPEVDRLSNLRVRPRMLTFATRPDTVRRTPPRVPYPASARTLLSSDVRVDPDGEESDVSVLIRDTNADSSAADSNAADSSATDTTRVDSSRIEARPTLVSFALERGHVVAMADPDLLRTDQLRNCTKGTALSMVRALEVLSRGQRRPVVFAEYYQGQRTDGPTVVLQEWLQGTGAGRTVLTMLGAGLVLLLARGRRTLAPVYRVREERRSALEHVDALATAWQAVRGTRTVARLLARGIRRRHAAGRWRALDDAAFLAALAERHPSIADDAARLTRAMDTPASPSDLPALRQAAAHIDAECLTP
jgi:hypothetical protein